MSPFYDSLLIFNSILSMWVGAFYGVKAQEELQSIGMLLKNAFYLSSYVFLITLIISLTGVLHLLSIVNAGNVVGVQVSQNFVITFSSQLPYYALAMVINRVVSFLYTMAGSLIVYMLNLIARFNNDFNAPYL